MAHKSHPCLVLSNTVGKGRPLYSLAGRGKEPKSVFSLQRAGVERDHCQKPWRYFSAVYHQWYIWVQTGRWQHSLLCSSSSPGGTCSPSCPDLRVPCLEQEAFGNWTAMIINQPHEYASFLFLEWKPFMKLECCFQLLWPAFRLPCQGLFRIWCANAAEYFRACLRVTKEHLELIHYHQKRHWNSENCKQKQTISSWT